MIVIVVSLILISLLAAFGFTGLSLREQAKVSAPDDQNQTNLEAFEAQTHVLKDELVRGLISQTLYQQLLSDLERKLLGDVPDQAAAAGQMSQPINPKYLIISAVFCVILSALVYFSVFVDKSVWQRYQDVNQYQSAVADSIQQGRLVDALLSLPLSRLVPILQSYALQDVNDDHRWRFLGQFFLRLDQAQLAELALKRAYTLTKDLNVGMSYLQAKLKLNQGRLNEDSERVLRDLSMLANDDPQFNLLQAAIYYQSGRYEEAVRIWSGLVSRAPEDLSDSARQGVALIQGYLDEAKRKLAAQLKLTLEIQFSDVALASAGYLWVVAKPINDSGPPLAVKKIAMDVIRASVKSNEPQEAFVYRMQLTEQDAMLPELTISTQSNLLIKTMISRNATLEVGSDDWIAVQRPNWQTDGSVIRLSLTKPGP